MGLSGFASRVWVGLTMLGVGCLWVWGGLGGSWDGLFFLTSCMNASYIFSPTRSFVSPRMHMRLAIPRFVMLLISCCG